MKVSGESRKCFSKMPRGMQPFIKMKGPGGAYDIGAHSPSLCARVSEGKGSREVD